MEVQIHAKNVEMKPPLREHVEKKLSKLDRYMPNIVEARIDLAAERQKRGGERAAIDLVLGKMYRRIRSYKGKRRRRGGDRFAELEPELAMAEPVPGESPEDYEDEKIEVVRRKDIVVSPMSEIEAIEQMELLGHDFFVFLNKDSAELNIAYAREDGNYGILRPQVA